MKNKKCKKYTKIEINVALKDVSVTFDFQQSFRTDRYKELQKMHILENDVSQVE